MNNEIFDKKAGSWCVVDSIRAEQWSGTKE